MFIKWANGVLTWFTGRNGMMKCAGISVSETVDGLVWLSPMTSKGVEGRCDITFPPAYAIEVADAILKSVSPYWLTRDEWRPIGVRIGKLYAHSQPESWYERQADDNHKRSVEVAVRKGIAVPSNVMKDYQHLLDEL